MLLYNNAPLMRELIEEMDYMIRIMDEDHNVIYMNKKMSEVFGHTLGHICYSLLGREEKCEHCVTEETKETGKKDTKHVPIGDRYYDLISSPPVSTVNGKNYSIELLHDITDEKKTEDELLKHYEKLKADIEFAKHIQERALPIDGVCWDTIEINSDYLPSEDLGGDLFDVIKMNDSESLIYIADVSGHGITSSLLTIFLRQVVRGRIGETKVDLKEILELLQKSYNELGVDKEQYLTILFCLYNKEKREATFLNAGHNCMPVLIKNTGEVREIKVKGMPVCSLMKVTPREEATVSVESGDRIILYTDGIMEACSGELAPRDSRQNGLDEFDMKSVLKIIEENKHLGGKALAEKVVEEAEACVGRPVPDDMAILVTKLI
ncbi:MAG TPA: SpoIIE family protein phosphatase [Bacillota bacterium]|nr:SpoIIE family protein phosphatase [Bacillota bacterium]